MARPRSDIQPRIVHAARARFLEDGVDGASLRDIARDARTNVGMVVYYFPTKDDLFLAVIEEVYAVVLVDLEAALTAQGSARDRLRNAVLRIGLCNPQELDVLRLTLREVLLSSTRFQSVLARLMRGHLPLFLNTVAEGVAQGEFDANIPLPLLVLSVFGMCGLPQIIRHAGGAVPVLGALPDAPQLADQMFALLFKAVGAPGASVEAQRPSTAIVAEQADVTDETRGTRQIKRPKPPRVSTTRERTTPRSKNSSKRPQDQ